MLLSITASSQIDYTPQIINIPHAVNIDWSLSITTERPARGTQDDVKYGPVTLPGDQALDLSTIIGNNVFNGGICKLTFSINQSDPVTYQFKIRGKNPKPQNAYSYINAIAGALYYYAWGIAKHESAQDDYNATYCQFNAGPQQLIGQPNYSASGSDNGWGIFQRDDTGGGVYVDTVQVYSWKKNSDIAVKKELLNKRAGVIQYLTGLKNSSPKEYNEDLPPSYPSGAGIIFSAIDTLTIETYNGAGLYTKLLQFTPKNPKGQRWQWGGGSKINTLPNAPRDTKPYIDRIAERMKNSP